MCVYVRIQEINFKQLLTVRYGEIKSSPRHKWGWYSTADKPHVHISTKERHNTHTQLLTHILATMSLFNWTENGHVFVCVYASSFFVWQRRANHNVLPFFPPLYSLRDILPLLLAPMCLCFPRRIFRSESTETCWAAILHTARAEFGRAGQEDAANTCCYISVRMKAMERLWACQDAPRPSWDSVQIAGSVAAPDTVFCC